MIKKTALITGGTSGIGYELAKLFAHDEYNLVIVAQDKEKLVETKRRLEDSFAIHVDVMQKDLSQPESAQEVFTFLQEKNIYIDILVNNAGFGAYGEFIKTDWLKEAHVMQVNMMTLTHLTKLFLQQVKKDTDGNILNVASTAAFLPGPLMAVYYATKAYVLSFSLALAEELEGSKIRVTALCPGPTKTGFQKRASVQHLQLFVRNVMGPEIVAMIGYNGMRAGKKIVIPGLRNTILIKMTRVVSPVLAAKVVKRMQKESVS